ncbi:MAG: MgtC/SapB family protein [Leptonema sp. (in: bacteria)]
MEVSKSIIIQILLSITFGSLIGIDRELKRKPGGLRTHILICLGATFLMIISKHSSGALGDPTRIAAQVISGIGFIGGGVIMKYGFNIKGITTAATIWIVTAIGLGIGSELYLESGMVTCFALIILFFVNKIEHKFFEGDEFKILVIDIKSVNSDDTEIKEKLKKFRLKVKTLEIEKYFNKNRTRYQFLIPTPRDLDLENLINDLYKIKRIQKI